MRGASRRNFLRQLATTAATASTLSRSAAAAVYPGTSSCQVSESNHSLDGPWKFRLDPNNVGESEGWYLASAAGQGWSEVRVPHTWQVSAESTDYQGAAWYCRSFESPSSWAGCAVRLEFEAVYHSAKVWLNDKFLGQHLGSGYTAFTLDASSAVRPGQLNLLAVKVDNAFDEHMLPRGKSFDWAADGGIIRPVHLRVTPLTFIERIDVDAPPEPASPQARLEVRLALQNSGKKPVRVKINYQVLEDDTGLPVLKKQGAATARLEPGTAQSVILPRATFADPRLWHFDRPQLYRLVAEIQQDAGPRHRLATTFGVRKVEVKDGAFYLNGERLRLMGVERMAGSNPAFGMAEPPSWIIHDLDEMKELNAVFTRVHWQQDRGVLDYCDRKGILIQEEIPAWGSHTFEGMATEPSPDIMENGLDQLREMINRDRNHPSIFAWGLGNEINGQNLPAYEFVRRMAEKARKLDPHRLLTYASNSLQKTVNKDVAGLMDFIEWNEYYESWYKGTTEDIKRNLEEIHRAFPDKTIVVSEYGYCECTPDRLGGDPRRIEILREHTQVFRGLDYVAGVIFFCYNDYRTHLGDKGKGALKQRVHGVVDLYGTHKPSFEALERESSPVEQLLVKVEGNSLLATLKTRSDLPACVLEGYSLRCIVHGFDGLPMEKRELPLPRLAPGQTATFHLAFQEANPQLIEVDLLRPTGFSAGAGVWRSHPV